MFAASSKAKLPRWESKLLPYRRSPFGRRLRILVLVLCVIAWYHHGSSSTPMQSKSEKIKTDAANRYPQLGQSQKMIWTRDERSGTETLQGDGDHNTAERQMVTPEYEEVEAVMKQSIRPGKPKTEASDGLGGVEIVHHAPPDLVVEAAGKLVEQKPIQLNQLGETADTVEPVINPLRFPSYAEWIKLGDKADLLPDVVHTPFEESTSEVILEGWEDKWFSEAELDISRWGKMKEPKIDFVYTWVNGSDTAFQDTIYPYEVNSSLNDAEGIWLASHQINRYRDWDELRYSIRSVEKYASSFRNKIQLLVNSVATSSPQVTVESPAVINGKQRPLWLKTDDHTSDIVQILSQEDFFDKSERGCLPTFNSLSIENQIYNTESDTDRLFALSDDMLLGKPHAASDIYSPLFGPTMGFKSNSYNTVNPPTDLDARRFGEKPFLIYTSWLLNRRFGERKRKGQSHFGHSLSRTLTREAIRSFPRPALQSTCQRFRGETGFQLYSWYVAFHYTIERHREALLWSYIVLRSDKDRNGNLGFAERQAIIEDLEEGMAKEGSDSRKRMYYSMDKYLKEAGLQPPKVNVDVQWTSIDGPVCIKDIECLEFNVNECLAPGFSLPSSDENYTNIVFSTASIFDRLTRQRPKCGDCLLKLVLNRSQKGLGPLLPNAKTQSEDRQKVVRAIRKYQYTIVEPDAFFVMVTDAEQVENLISRRLHKTHKGVGQLCLNDDVVSDDETVIEDTRKAMAGLLEKMYPEPSIFEVAPNALSE